MINNSQSSNNGQNAVKRHLCRSALDVARNRDGQKVGKCEFYVKVAAPPTVHTSSCAVPLSSGWTCESEWPPGHMSTAHMLVSDIMHWYFVCCPYLPSHNLNGDFLRALTTRSGWSCSCRLFPIRTGKTGTSIKYSIYFMSLKFLLFFQIYFFLSMICVALQ